MIEEAAAATRDIRPVQPVEPPPALRYQVKILVDAGEVATFLRRWQYLTQIVDEMGRARMADHGVTASPPAGMISAGWRMDTTERTVWVPEQTHEQELIAWSARVRSQRNG